MVGNGGGKGSRCGEVCRVGWVAGPVGRRWPVNTEGKAGVGRQGGSTGGRENITLPIGREAGASLPHVPARPGVCRRQAPHLVVTPTPHSLSLQTYWLYTLLSYITHSFRLQTSALPYAFIYTTDLICISWFVCFHNLLGSYRPWLVRRAGSLVFHTRHGSLPHPTHFHRQQVTSTHSYNL